MACHFVWNDATWTACSHPCGDSGTRSRAAIRVRGDDGCTPPPAQVQPCNRFQCNRDCVFQWGPWSPCSQPCGGGTQAREPVVSSQPQFAGRQCPLPQVRACNSFACGQDCDYEWDDWTECDVDCGGGRQQRAPIIHRRPGAGGKPCPLPQVRACNELPCEK